MSRNNLQFGICNLQVDDKKTSQFLPDAKKALPQTHYRRTGLAVENFAENSGRVCVVRYSTPSQTSMHISIQDALKPAQA